ncbi:MAG: spermine synthase [Caldilinea sp. CFX5]|nr:spermine synthase [Caldilinea sp. CFX5]
MMRRFLLLIVFFLTGAAALIYQVTWVRQATLVFGVSVYAYSIVLAAFMGGMALGSYWLGRRAATINRPLRLFGLLQVGIAFCGFGVPYGLKAIMPLYATLVQQDIAGPWLLLPVRILFALLLLTPATILMGATLPLLTKVIARPGTVGGDVGRLYAADTLGAALACALTGLFLLRTLGVYTTSWSAVGLNLLAALLVLAVGQAFDKPTHEDQVTPSQPPVRARSASSLPKLGRVREGFLLWAYALSGFVALGYEIVWARVLAIFTLNAVFSFSIMLATFLAGLTIGGWIGAWWMRNRRVTVADFAYIQSAIGLAAFGTLFVFARLPALTLEDAFGVYSLTNVIYFEFLLGFLTLLLPTILIGLLFPVAISLYTQEQAERAATQVGLLSAYNTAGGVAGALLTGFVLIPLLGLQNSGALLALTNLGLGAYLLWSKPLSPSKQNPLFNFAGVGVGLLLFALLPAGYYLGFRSEPTEQMVFYEEGVETTVAVFEVPEHNFKISFVNGRIEVPTDEVSMLAFRLLGHLPAILKPDAQQALMLSFGNGVATGSLASHGIPHIDAVDLSAEQFAAAELYWIENYNVLRNPRLQIHVEDGRNFLLQTPLTYDIITTDATHPVNSSSWALFTQEFYQSVRARLRADGVFVQWLPFHNLLEPEYQEILRTFQAVFPHATLWYTGGSHTTLVATPTRLTEEGLRALLQQAADQPTLTTDLGPATLLRAYWIMDEDALRTYAGDGPLATDDTAYFLPEDHDNERLLQMMERLAAQAQQPR